jgi:raffinose/stachyose/melibiose transport system substrate-binding protein
MATATQTTARGSASRFWGAGALACVLALGIAGCGGSSGQNGGGSAAGTPTVAPGPATTRVPSGPVRLTMWWWGQQEAPGASKWLADTIAAYHKLHPNVTINTVLQTTNGLIPSFDAAAKAGQGPDIEYFWGGIYSQEPGWAGNIRPVSDYIPAAELHHYLNAYKEDIFQGKVWTAPWYLQPSFPVLYRKDILQQHHIAVPTTWNQLLAACKTLKSAGITPMAGGVSDGWFGGWLYSLLGDQQITSVKQVLDAVVGKGSFTNPALGSWWSKLAQMKSSGCWNGNITSQQLYQGQQAFVQGKAAMTVSAGTAVPGFVKQVGVNKVGVMAMPSFANGPYSGRLGATSQTVGITAWSKYPTVDANFIMFMHTQARLLAWYKDTGDLPADDRFPVSAVKLPQVRQLFNMEVHGAPYLENFIPSQLDSEGNFSNAQLVLGGSETGSQAAAKFQEVATRVRITDSKEMADFAIWAKSVAG